MPVHAQVEPKLVPFLGQNGLYGYADTEGNLVIPTVYYHADLFRNGVALVLDSLKKPHLIDQNDQKLKLPHADELRLFSNANHTLLELRTFYVNRWRFWEWRFLPGFQIIGGGSSDKRLFDTGVAREKRSMYWLEGGKFLKTKRGRSHALGSSMQVEWLDSHRVWIDDDIFQLKGKHAQKILRRVKQNQIVRNGAILREKGSNYQLVDTYGNRTSKEKFNAISTLTLSIPSATESEIIEMDTKPRTHLRNRLGDFYENSQGEVYVFPEFEYSFPRNIQAYHLSDTISAGDILKKTQKIVPIGKTNRFILSTNFGMNIFVLDTQGVWHDPEESKDLISVVQVNGSIVWPEFDYVLNTDSIPEGWDVRSIRSARYGKDWYVVTLRREEDRLEGIWDKTAGEWIMPPTFNYISTFNIEGPYIAFQEEKDGNWGYYDLQQRSNHIPPRYDYVSPGGWVRLPAEGSFRLFYVDIASRREYVEMPIKN